MVKLVKVQNIYVLFEISLRNLDPSLHSNFILFHLDAHMAPDFRKHGISTETETVFKGSKSLCQLFSKFSVHKNDAGDYSALPQMPAPT